MVKRINIIYQLANGKNIMILVTNEVKSAIEEDKKRIQNQQRQDRRHIFLTDLIDNLCYESEALIEQDACSMIIRKEGYEELNNALKKLTKIQYRRLVLRFEYNMSCRQIAIVEKVNHKTVSESIKRAIAILYSELYPNR